MRMGNVTTDVRTMSPKRNDVRGAQVPGVMVRHLRRLIPLLGCALLLAAPAEAQLTDLSGLKFCIDPGHGGHNGANDRHLIPDPGTDFWESESNFQKALRLDTLLQARGAWVILTRYTNDYPADDEPSLSARYTLANTNNVHWFHSIHSNATGWASNTTVNYTLVLVKEDIATRQAAWPQAVTMSNIIGPSIYGKIRDQYRSTWTYLDYTFYGGTSGGFNLGVLRGLLMPGELSEGSFHDYFPETRRLMNPLYCKMESYALRNAFMQYFGVPADTLGIVAGIQSDVATGKLVNLSRVRLMPGDRVVTGDVYNNGFYMFDDVHPGTYTLRFETPGYTADSMQVTVGTGATVFADKALVVVCGAHHCRQRSGEQRYRVFGGEFHPDCVFEADGHGIRAFCVLHHPGGPRETDMERQQLHRDVRPGEYPGILCGLYSPGRHFGAFGRRPIAGRQR